MPDLFCVTFITSRDGWPHYFVAADTEREALNKAKKEFNKDYNNYYRTFAQRVKFVDNYIVELIKC